MKPHLKEEADEPDQTSMEVGTLDASFDVSPVVAE